MNVIGLFISTGKSDFIPLCKILGKIFAHFLVEISPSTIGKSASQHGELSLVETPGSNLDRMLVSLKMMKDECC